MASDSLRMAPKKGSGPSKGKQPAPKKPSKRAAPPPSSSEDEDDEVQRAIMARLRAVEQAIGVQVPQAIPVSDAQGQTAKHSSANKRLQAEILTRLSLIEDRASSSAAAAAATRASGPRSDFKTTGQRSPSHI
ncbi:UNVERIFIED_CONTAM: hypothetical protein K2H54_050853 [Gekko kuhli]